MTATAEFAELYLGHTRYGVYDPVELAKHVYISGDVTFDEFEELTDMLILNEGLSDVTCPRCGSARKGLRLNDSMAALRCDCGFSGYVDG